MDKFRFVSIDYVDDQCDMEARSESKDGVSDDIVKFTAYSIIHATKTLIKNRNRTPKKYTILLKRNGRIAFKGLGMTQIFYPINRSFAWVLLKISPYNLVSKLGLHRINTCIKVA
jgi:hypothetical protein